MSQDENPFGTPRGAWGRQPPTTFGLSGAITPRPQRPALIRAPAPRAETPAPRNILSGGLLGGGMTPAPAARTEPIAAPIVQVPPPPVEPSPPDRALVSDSVLARTSQASGAQAGRSPIPLIAGGGVLIAAAAMIAALLLAPKTPEPVAAAPAPAPVAPGLESPPPQSAPAAPKAAPRPPARTAARPRPAAIPNPAPIAPSPLAVPQVTAPAPAPAPAPPPAVAPPTDPEAPMTTRLPGPA